MNESPLIHSSASIPPRRKSPSSDPFVVPVSAIFNRANAPMRTAFAPAGELTSTGLMMSGSSTERIRSLERQDVASIAAATAAANRRRREFSNCICTVILEAKVETECHVARRRERLERGRSVAGGSVGLWIDARVLRPENAEVAYRARDREGSPAEIAACPAVRRVERQRQLTEAHEIAVLDESGDRLSGMIASSGDARLIERGRADIDVASAVVTAEAANTLAVVIRLEIALVVDHRLEPEATLQEVETIRQCDFVFGKRIPKVGRGVADDDLTVRSRRAVGDDAIVVLVLPTEQWSRPPAVERIALAILLRAADDDVGHATQAHELVGIR